MRNLPDPQQAKPCVLVIDDDPSIARALAARLGPDLRVVGVSDPAQAVASACSEAPGVILCDIHMPALPGDEVAFALSQDARTAGIPLVYLTGLLSPAESPEVEGVFGDYPMVSKSASTGELRAVVAAALGLPID
jgi:Response regulator containing CheY-like receiver, AAA-type ATPase, and DNA-binding domains